MKFDKLKKYIPLAIMVIYIILIVVYATYTYGDDTWFGELKGDIFSIIGYRYNTWTSRVFIESMLITLMRSAKWLWVVINSFMILLLYHSFNRVFNKDKSLLLKIVIAIFLVIFPYSIYKSAGWASTTINYLWPFTLGIYAFTLIIDELRGNEYKKWKLFLAIPALIFAINQEQIALLSLGFIITFIIYNYLKNKKISKLQILYLILTIGSLVFIFTCPGNMNRISAETLTWFNDYNSLNILDKSLLSINTAYEMLLGNINYIYILLYAVLIYYFIKIKNKKLLLVSIILLIGTIIIPFTNIFNLSYLYNTSYAPYSKMLRYLNLYSNSYNLSIIISIVYIITTTIVLYSTKLNNKDKYYKYLLPIMFLAAILSKMVVGFSPTVFASSTRTGIFMLYLIIMIIIIIVRECINMKGKHNGKKK